MRSSGPTSVRVQTSSPRELQFEALEERSLLAAQILTFDIDAARSFLALNGTLTAGGSSFTFESQSGGNSLVAAFDGTLEAELTDSTIQFLSGSVLDGLELRNSSGDLRLFQPPVPSSSSAAAADFAALINAGITTAEAAIRGLSFDAASGALAIGAGGNFSSGLIFTVDAGRMDFSIFGVRFAGDLTGKAAANGAGGSSQIQFGAGTIELTIPINIIITETTSVGALGTFDTTLRLSGSIVALVDFVDEGEPNDSPATALPIAPIQTIQGSLAGSADVDYFSVALVQAGKLLVRAESTGTAGNPIVTVINADGAVLATSSVGELTTPSLAAGTYFIVLSPDGTLTGVSDYLLQTNFQADIVKGDPGDGEVDPGDFIPINLDDLFNLQVGTFLFVKDLATSMQNGMQSSAPVILPFLLRFDVDPSMLPQVGNLLPTAGNPARAIYAPSSPMIPVSFFKLDRATTGGLSPLPTFAPNSTAVDARLAAAIARFGGGNNNNARTTSDSTDPAAPINAIQNRNTGSGRLPVVIPGVFGDVLDDLLENAVREAIESKQPQPVAPPAGDQSQTVPAIRPASTLDSFFANLAPANLSVDPDVCEAIAVPKAKSAERTEAAAEPVIDSAQASAGFLVVSATVFTDRIRRRRNRRGR